MSDSGMSDLDTKEKRGTKKGGHSRRRERNEKQGRRSFLKQLAGGAVGAAATAAGFPVPVSAHPAHGSQSGGAGQAEGEVTLCIFSKHLEWLDFGPMAETAADLGFDGIVLTVRPDGHVEPEAATEELPRAAEAIEAAGLDLPMITTAITRADGPHAEPILRTASELGVEYYRMGYYFYEDSTQAEARLDEIRPVWEDLAALNEELGLHGAYENHSGMDFVGAVLWDLWELLRDFDPEWLGCEFDVRHAMVSTGENWARHLARLSPYVRTITAKDFRWVGDESVGRDDASPAETSPDGSNASDPTSADTTSSRVLEPENCPIGEGVVPWDRYLQLLSEYDFAGPCSMHVEYPLGGANHGAEELEIDPEEVRRAIGADRKRFAAFLSGAGLRG